MKTETKKQAGERTHADGRVMIQWTLPMLERFKKAFAKSEGKDFAFDGNEYFHGYAFYLIQYLEGKFRGGK